MFVIVAACGGGGAALLQALAILDLAAAAGVLRVHGSSGNGALGVPVAGGLDCDGDGNADFAFAAFRADPLGRNDAGEVFWVFGDGTLTGTRDTAGDQPNVLRILGDETRETCGNEVWIDDVDGDGLGDLLIGRQNHGGGIGALTIVFGGAGARALAAALTVFDLRTPDASVAQRTITGTEALGRFGIWMRTGDVTGDGIADIVVGADQEGEGGAAYLIRGGAYLKAGGSLDGNLVRITPGGGSIEFHFGATCQIADLDGNGRAEVLIAATINRGGASIPANGSPPGSARASGGAPNGRLFIAWDDNFADPWPVGFTFDITQSPGARTIIRGEPRNRNFGEEIVAGIDFDGDGLSDLFVGDISGDLAGGRVSSGAGHVIYNAPALRGQDFRIDQPPAGVATTTILGRNPGDIANDTAVAGDFDGDGHFDLATASPHAEVDTRIDAGTIHVFYGGERWPPIIDLRNVPGDLRVTVITGANGRQGGDNGDVLAYSMATLDANGDGLFDLIFNEMTGNGLAPGTIDVGNLVVLSGARLPQ